MARKGAGALEIEWHEDGTFREIGWCDDFNKVIDKAIGVSRIRKVDMRDFEAVYRVRHTDGNTYYYLMPRKTAGTPENPMPDNPPTTWPAHGF